MVRKNNIKCEFIKRLSKKEICEMLSNIFCDFEWNLKNAYGGDLKEKMNMGEYFKTATKK